MVHGLTSASLGKPDYNLALFQHARYVEALQERGLELKALEPDNRFPDSTFVEDIALCTPEFAVITHPGAPSRRGETKEIRNVLSSFYAQLENIEPPGTLEAGDVMMAGNHFCIGLSGRTNAEGACQLVRILEKYGYSGETILLKDMLHLKSGVSYLEQDRLLVVSQFAHHPAFKDFHKIEVDPMEAYSANSLWVNGIVLVPEGFPRTREKIERAGYSTVALDVSEFQKLDGGLSCLSLRF
jgi:dimethylargininase